MRILYTDGSAAPNPGPGGYAVIENGKPIALGGEPMTTNIRMEGIYTDSDFWRQVLMQWAPNWQINGWKKKKGDIKNLDIVKPLYELYCQSNAEIIWLKGHAGHEYNELADSWANKAREGQRIENING